MAAGKSGKKVSRARQLELQLRAAAAVDVADSYDVVVVGGGAAGLAAAIAAAESGASVLVLERDVECGRTILATGNGRCNFANVELDSRRYHNADFVGQAFGQDPLDTILKFFRACGLFWALEGDRLYPASRQAASVRNVLLARAAAEGVTLAPAREAASLTRLADDTFKLGFCEAFAPEGPTTSAGEKNVRPVLARRVILAMGGQGSALAEGLGLKATPATPLLCPLACDAASLAGPLLSQLDGRRAHVSMRLVPAGREFPVWQERGEVLFRSYGLSGIVTFDLSRRAHALDVAQVDLAPDVTQAELRALVDPFARGTFTRGCLDGVLDPVIAQALESFALAGERAGQGPASQVLLDSVKSLPFTILGTTEERSAQVRRGGLAVGQFDPVTLEATGASGLHACGEALDVDADCGGFNLSWAWVSGLSAGRAAATSLR